MSATLQFFEDTLYSNTSVIQVVQSFQYRVRQMIREAEGWREMEGGREVSAMLQFFQDGVRQIIVYHLCTEYPSVERCWEEGGVV